MKHDIKLNIAIGASASSKSWKNKSMMWSELLKRLSNPVVTTETHKEFINMSKDDQHKIKDVGGYVGGYLRNGRRLQSNVVSRQLLTLDIDFAHTGMWDDFTMLFDNAALIHATHKHIETSPRYRLVMPLDREVTPDEYGAISRKVAEILDIELFDNTTFDPSRLMFWASTPKDIEYYYEYQDGEILSADNILAMYLDWTDTSLWATSGDTLNELKDRAQKQEDPLLKKGLIGAFCRTYTITEALETFLADEYVESAVTDRYTYKNGTTAAGLIVYDDKYTFSHHGTDPTSGKLCNAFDLVRLHKFGYHDTGESDSRKSFKMMEDFVIADEATRETLATERLASVKYDFAEAIDDDFDDELAELFGEDEESEKEEQINWMKTLETDKNGFLSSATNLNIIFTNDKRLKNTFRYNLFDSRQYVFNTLPWRKIPNPEPIRNVDYSGVRNYIESLYKISGALKIDDALNLEFERNSYHPVREYLSGLKWDGISRVETLLIEYFGTPDTIYHREAIKSVLIAGCKRIFEPGCKMDNVLVIVGGQGCGKSTFVRKLGVDWFSDTFLTVHGKEAMEQINSGVWVLEMAELAGLKKAEVEPIKHFISKPIDTFRPAYGKTSETFKRQCIFIGTTNDRNFLRDDENRRFLPIDVDMTRATKSTIKGLDRKEIDQIWAEAYQLYRKGGLTYLSEEAEELARIEQKDHTLVDERAGLIEQYLNTPIAASWDSMDLETRLDWYRNEDVRKDASKTKEREIVCTAEIWAECFGKKREDMTPYNTKEINNILRSLYDWEPLKTSKRFKLYGTQKYYVKIKSKNLAN